MHRDLSLRQMDLDLDPDRNGQILCIASASGVCCKWLYIINHGHHLKWGGGNISRIEYYLGYEIIVWL